ncbi:MAG: hypothetical protein HYZ93_06070 [Candidatus Omnitrophica bacterium]|nr:hypothetical protein [Candidatus Omnitrophota bacterium]
MPPRCSTSAPRIAVGSSPAFNSSSAAIAVVVLFPCAPVTAMIRRPSRSLASISPRCRTGIRRFLAAISSGFCGEMEEE